MTTMKVYRVNVTDEELRLFSEFLFNRGNGVKVTVDNDPRPKYLNSWSDWGSTYIAGVNFHDLKNPKSVMFYQGKTVKEPQNIYDSNAVALYTQDGKLAGYIPSVNSKNGYENNRHYQTVLGNREDLRWLGYVYPADKNAGYTTCGKVIFYRDGLDERHLRKDINNYFDYSGFPTISKKVKLYSILSKNYHKYN